MRRVLRGGAFAGASAAGGDADEPAHPVRMRRRSQSVWPTPKRGPSGDRLARLPDASETTQDDIRTILVPDGDPSPMMEDALCTDTGLTSGSSTLMTAGHRSAPDARAAGGRQQDQPARHRKDAEGHANIDLVFADNGVEAVEQFRGGAPDLFFTDISMPKHGRQGSRAADPSDRGGEQRAPLPDRRDHRPCDGRRRAGDPRHRDRPLPDKAGEEG